MKNKNHTHTQQQQTRRSFLKRIWVALGLVAGAELLWVSSGFLRPGKRHRSVGGEQLIVAGKVDDFDPGDVFPYRNGQFYLVRYKNGGFLAISLKCSHLGCGVIWDEQSKVFNCPCHASSFDAYGDVIKPPAPKALDTHPVIIREGQVLVDIGRTTKRKSFEQSQIVFA